MRILESAAASIPLELDPANYPEFCARALAFESAAQDFVPEPRIYPGYPAVSLGAPSKRVWMLLSRALQSRRSARNIEGAALTKKKLSTVLYYSHGAHRSNFAGPVPSSGGLQALHLYMVWFVGAWLHPAVYHYNRKRHALEAVCNADKYADWRGLVPSLEHVNAPSALWIIAGDAAGVTEKYGARAAKLLLLEAGHLMQNLCLTSAALGACTVPLGGFFENKIKALLKLPETDLVLYTGAFGKPR